MLLKSRIATHESIINFLDANKSILMRKHSFHCFYLLFYFVMSTIVNLLAM